MILTSQQKVILLSILLLAFTISIKAQQNSRPNILLIVADDMVWNSISILNSDNILQTPGIDRIGNEGARFKCYATNSLCMPARTAINSGMYGHRTGPLDNYTYPDDSVKLLPKILHQNGYFVGLIGKWMLAQHNPEPNFDYWLWSPNQSTYYNDTCWYFNNPVLVNGHMTDFITDSALALISRIDTPFYLTINHNAPHIPLIPQQQFAGIFDTTIFPIPLSFEKYTTNYPSPLDFRNYFISANAFQNRIRLYMEMMAGVDESINKIIDSLDHLGLLENTMVIFTSDNCNLFGEHKLYGKSFPYEECMRIPLLIRYPPWFNAGTIVDSSFSLNIDLAPSILDAAGIADSFNMDGVSLRAVLNGQYKRKEFLYEQMAAYPTDSIPAVRTYRDELFQYNKYFCTDTTEELFDLKNDSLQMTNLVNAYCYQTVLQQYRYKLDSLRTVLNDTIAIPICSCYLKNPVFNNESPPTFLTEFLCAGTNYEFNGQQLNTTGFYSDTLHSIFGCDSVVQLSLTILPPIIISQTEIICSGSSYNFNGQQLNSTGVFSDTLLSISGCDSVVNLSLTVLPPIINSQIETICAGEIFNFNGINISVSGLYSDTVLISNNCDSVISLELIVDSINTLIQQHYDTLFSNDTGDIQWYDCNSNQIISGATNNNFTPSASGVYSVIIINNNCVDTSECFPFILGINESDFFSSVLIYPNPSSDILFIKYKFSDDCICTIYNQLGQKENELLLERTNNNKLISLKGLTSSLYLLIIKNKKGETFNMKLTVL